MVPIAGITQLVSGTTCANPFTLQPGFSCMLTLILNPAALPETVRSGPEICKTMGPGNNSPDPFLCSQACGSSALNINAFRLLSLTISPSNPTKNPGDTQQFTATAHYSNGSTQDVTTTVTWSSSIPSIATISNASGTKGLATAISPGVTTITATLDGVSASTTLTVATPIIVVTPANTTINHGQNQQFTATEIFPDGTMTDVTNIVTWTSSNTSIATMSGTTQGLAITSDPGTTVITATLGTISGSTNLTVGNELLYVANQGNSSVDICPLDPTTGNFFSACVDSGAGGIFGTDTAGIVINATGTLAFVSSATTVTHCTINNNGAGTFSNCATQTIPGMVNGTGMAIDSTGTMLYIADQNVATPTSSEVILCTVNATTGVINTGTCLNAGTPPPSLNGAYDITLNVGGTQAYISNEVPSTVTRCNVTAGTGVLTTCSDTIGATFLNSPQGLAFNTASTTPTILYVINTGGTPEVSMCASGTAPCDTAFATPPPPPPPPQAARAGIVFNTKGTYVYMSNAAVVYTALNGTIVKCAVDVNAPNKFTSCVDQGFIDTTTSEPQLLTTR